ncbi:hypothetical protein PoB_001129500 [Plakobranchus ocellatus]|uniref:Uncharacterized protein n=1 Tax=Plakobranchus ocellatus TaxID=259542 RepID=A0AAV3YQR8_9GAST|nr:hypothetical protein PoB_001129500 [Plakobranchus ocellatus]
MENDVVDQKKKDTVDEKVHGSSWATWRGYSYRLPGFDASSGRIRQGMRWRGGVFSGPPAENGRMRSMVRKDPATATEAINPVDSATRHRRTLECGAVI